MTFDSVTRKLSPSALFDGLSYYLTTMTDATGKVRENGWMAARDEQELLGYAKAMGYSIDFAYLGQLDRSVYHCDVVPGTESVVYRQLFPERFCSKCGSRKTEGLCCCHDWQEQPGEPPTDVCSSCGLTIT